MRVLLALAGLGIVAAALFDFAWTTLAVGQGGGPFTRRLASWAWRVALALHRRQPAHRLLAAAGPTILLAIVTAWVVAVLTGWWLVFLAADGAVRDATTDVPASVVDRLYFTGYTVFTLGIGDYAPGRGLWQIATVAATASGLVLVTLGISYLMPVASAVSQRRALAGTIAALGDDSEAIVTGAWNGATFGALPDHLVSLLGTVEMSRQQHLAYPVLHYFHSGEARTAAAVKMAHLAQALEVLRLGVAPEARPDRTTLEPLHRAVGTFLDTLAGAAFRPAEDGVASVDLAALRAAGIPTTDEAGYREALTANELRRRQLAGMVLEAGWQPTHPGCPGR